MTSREPVTIIGAGLAGSLLAILLARRGIPVVLLERRPDPRTQAGDAGRSINLALAARGIHALERAGLYDAARPLLIPMSGRQLHARDGSQAFVPYGQQAAEAIHSVSRPGLNRLLLDHLSTMPNVVMGFQQECLDADFERQLLRMRDHPSGQSYTLPLKRVIGSDGAGSAIRGSMAAALAVGVREEWLSHGYKELTLPAGPGGAHQLERNALHIWPRGEYMLIALPNLDGSFTLTLFMPLAGVPGFATLDTTTKVEAFFASEFPDVASLMPNLGIEYEEHPVGRMATVYCNQWAVGDQVVLLGDAAHAIVPFHGQGMNCAFEDCVALDALLQQHPWQEACTRFVAERKHNTDAIAAMALENYLEMRDSVRDERFQLKRMTALELERRNPDRFIPRYSMVMFHPEISYATAYERGCIQNTILEEITRDIRAPGDIDFSRAQTLIAAKLPPLQGSSNSGRGRSK